jgi:hypothetical protein
MTDVDDNRVLVHDGMRCGWRIDDWHEASVVARQVGILAPISRGCEVSARRFGEVPQLNRRIRCAAMKLAVPRSLFADQSAPRLRTLPERCGFLPPNTASVPVFSPTVSPFRSNAAIQAACGKSRRLEVSE